MQHQIMGTTLQSLEILLQPGEMVYSQTHQMAWMSNGIGMNTNTGGGVLKGLMRSMSGGSLFLTQYASNTGHPGLVAFCPRFPGTIIARQLAPGEVLICRKETFLCGESSVQLDIFFRQQIGSGFFGGEGFILQKVTGPGWVFLDLSGEVVEKLLQPGEQLLAHVGHVGMQEQSVQFGITRIKGMRNIIFGGDGLFLATLTGPGRVWLQTMPVMILAEEILKHAPGGDRGSAGGVAGDILGGLLGR
ncbi:MAG: TIGR00266 family protein [Capsulimonas sp.]|uniref:TIGR00266 family protein n=1 Tax=Capsulimonas sp. TaxID=2494211 RepID=UPI003266FBC1